VRVHVPDCQCPGRRNISSFVKLRRGICGYLKTGRHRDGPVREPHGIETFHYIRCC
jgi:hypothetical protein